MNGYGFNELSLAGSVAVAGTVDFSEQGRYLHNGPEIITASRNRFSQRILVPVDFSEVSLEGARYALELAENQPTEIILLHVIDVKFNWPPSGPVNVSELREEMWGEAEKKMQNLAATIHRAAVSVQPVISEGSPWEVIATEARRRGATLILIGRETKKRHWHPFHRHTARRVMDCAPCPVLTVP